MEKRLIVAVLVAGSTLGVAACNTHRPGPYQSHFPGFFGPGTHGGQSGAGLVGRWKSKNEEINIQQSGTVIISGVTYSYTVNGNALNVTGQNTSASYPFELVGDTLTVTINGQPVVYTRIVETPPSTPATTSTTPMPMPTIGGSSGGPPPNGAAAAPAPAPAGSVVPELVGKWCYMSNVNANDGGRQSNTCFALNGDGTYWYHSETSSSGPFGSSASQSDDQGHWVASGNTLTATSNSGKVASYTFQKQNHPKTRDPMLVVNGQAFVTYFQKPPW